jgi:hypothetical protein
MAFRSPTSFTLGQQPGIIADWAIKNGSKKAVSRLGARRRSGQGFRAAFHRGGGQL